MLLLISECIICKWILLANIVTKSRACRPLGPCELQWDLIDVRLNTNNNCLTRLQDLAMVFVLTFVSLFACFQA